MQITLATSFGLPLLGVPGVGDALALYSQGGQAYLIYGADSGGALSAVALGSLGTPGSGYMTAESLAGLTLQPGSGMAVQQAGTTTRLFSFAGQTAPLTMQVIGANGMPGAAQAVTVGGAALVGVSSFDILGGPGGDQAALSFWNQPGLTIYGLSGAGALSWQASIADTAKSYLGNVSDTLSVTVGGVTYLLCTSSLEGGITSLAVDGQGKAGLVDSLGAVDGLPLAGAAAMQAVTLGGITYAVVAATGSSALTVVRVNDMGCLFATDTLYDDRTTRFAGAEVIDSFTWAGRVFVVTGGRDAGLSILELRPDGKLTPFLTGVFETGTGLQTVTSLEAAVSGSRLDVYVVDEAQAAIQDFRVDLAGLGGMITAAGGTTTGTALGDLIWGGSGAQVLNGAAGDDWIFDGSGADTLTGGSGADVFLLAKDGAAETVTDFELHKDRIDLSDWGRIYQPSDLMITPTANGAILSWGSESVTLIQAGGGSLTGASFTADDFIFI